MKTYFDHEKLNVYQASIEFVSWAEVLIESLPKSLAATNQLDRASTSISLNIAEGNGKFTEAESIKSKRNTDLFIANKDNPNLCVYLWPNRRESNW